MTLTALQKRWWLPLALALIFPYTVICYYWGVSGFLQPIPTDVTEAYTTNVYYTTGFFTLIAVSAWLRCRGPFKDDGERGRVLQSTGILLTFLGLATVTLTTTVVLWQSLDISMKTMAGEVFYPPILPVGSVDLLLVGITLALYTWTPDRRRLLYKQLYRLVLVAAMGFSPYILWFSVRFLHFATTLAAALGVGCFIISLTLLLAHLEKMRVRFRTRGATERGKEG